MINFIKKKLFGAYTVTTQNIQLYKYDDARRELVIYDGPSPYPAHLVIKEDVIFLYIDEQMKRLIEAKIHASNFKSMSKLMSEALRYPTTIYEILGLEKRTGVKMYRVQKEGTATRMEIHVSDKYFSLHSDYDHTINQYRSVAQFFQS